MSDLRPDDAAPRYRLAVCDGPRCRDLAGVEDVDVGEAGVAAWLRDLARVMRERGVVGRLVVRDADSGRIVAAWRVWP